MLPFDQNLKEEFLSWLPLILLLINKIKQGFLYNLAKIREADSFDEICLEICQNFELRIEGHPNYKDVDVVKKNILKWVSTRKIPMVLGAEKMIRTLYEHNIPMAIVTNLESRVFEKLLERTVGLEEQYISHYVCSATDPEIEASKPAPDVYLVCAKRFSPPPKSRDNCVIFGNSIRGITGALATGMKTVLITDKTIRELGGLADKTTRIIRSFNNFCPESIGLPSN